MAADGGDFVGTAAYILRYQSYIEVADPEGVQGVRSNPLLAPCLKISYENETMKQ